jgi:hypothetical protein
MENNKSDFEKMLDGLSESQLEQMMTDIAEAMNAVSKIVIEQKPRVYKVYYDAEGKVITYTTEDLPGNYLEITHEQYLNARHDAIVVNGQLEYTHLATNVFRMTATPNGEYRVSSKNMMIIADDDDQDYILHSLKVYRID